MVSKVLILLGACLSLAVSASSPSGLHVWTTLTQHTEAAISTLPASCAASSRQQLRRHQVGALGRVLSCDYDEVVGDLANIVLEAGTFLTMGYATVAEVVYDFVVCPAKLNPVEIIICLSNAVVKAYGPIVDYVSSAKEFIADMDELMPPLEVAVEECFSKGFTEYRNSLKSLIHEAKQCEARVRS